MHPSKGEIIADKGDDRPSHGAHARKQGEGGGKLVNLNHRLDSLRTARGGKVGLILKNQPIGPGGKKTERRQGRGPVDRYRHGS